MWQGWLLLTSCEENGLFRLITAHLLVMVQYNISTCNVKAGEAVNPIPVNKTSWQLADSSCQDVLTAKMFYIYLPITTFAKMF
jgi:hypothetical protein